MRRIALAVALFAGSCSLAAAARPLTLGYEYDIARGKVPKPETMRRVADILASLGYTQLQVYFKATSRILRIRSFGRTERT